MNLKSDELKIIENIMNEEPIHYIDEEFRYITYPGVRPNMYVISDYGTVISLNSKRIMKPFDRKGYLAIEFAGIESGTKIKVSVHRLVAWEFLGEYESSDMVVNHKDSCTHNNYKSNLEWCTQSENVFHALNNDNTYFAQRKFDKNTAIDICRLFSEGYSPKEVFKLYTGYDISNHDKSTWITINNIYKRKTYKNISKRFKW